MDLAIWATGLSSMMAFTPLDSSIRLDVDTSFQIGMVPKDQTLRMMTKLARGSLLHKVLNLLMVLQLHSMMNLLMVPLSHQKLNPLMILLMDQMMIPFLKEKVNQTLNLKIKHLLSKSLLQNWTALLKTKKSAIKLSETKLRPRVGS